MGALGPSLGVLRFSLEPYAADASRRKRCQSGGRVDLVDSAREKNNARAVVEIKPCSFETEALEPVSTSLIPLTAILGGATRADSFADGGMEGSESAWDAPGGQVHGGAPPQL